MATLPEPTSEGGGNLNAALSYKRVVGRRRPQVTVGCADSWLNTPTLPHCVVAFGRVRAVSSLTVCDRLNCENWRGSGRISIFSELFRTAFVEVASETGKLVLIY